MIGDLLMLLGGLSLLLGGGEVLVRGSSRLARALGVSPLGIGLTIVAFGTSAPELAVNMLAAWRGSGGISFGNVLGSNIANMGLIVGSAALLVPIAVKSSLIRREIPIMMLATLAAAALAVDSVFGQPVDRYDRVDGVILLLLFAAFLSYALRDLAVQRKASLEGDHERAPTLAIASHLGLTVVGLAVLLLGAHMTVTHAVAVAHALNIAEALIGLTIIAIGTSLPELVASLIASWRGYADLAVGNVVGSNIFNLLLVFGCSATVRPIEVPQGGYSDLVMTLLLSLLFWFVAVNRSQVITRHEAVALLLAYFLYLVPRTLYSTAWP